MANKSLVNFSNSILKHFDVELFHDSVSEIDEAIKSAKKVVVLLFDGMGRNIVRKHLKEDSYIRSHYLTTIDSTFPPTTAAATTAFLSGKHPIETGWIAWDAYFKDLDKNVILFRGYDYNTYEDLHINMFKDYLPYTSIIDLIKSKGHDAYNVSRYPIDKKGPKNLTKACKILTRKLKDSESCFIYFYWDSPDYEMHANGIDKKIITRKVKQVEKFVKSVTKHNPDTVFLTFADHGHVNVKYLDICEHDDLYSLLRNKISGEKRSSIYFVKEGKQEEFKELFNKYYGEHFLLLSKKEILESKLYGEGTPHPLFDDMIGDFISISQDTYAILASKEFKEIETFPGHHAGGTEEERLIDISIFNND